MLFTNNLCRHWAEEVWFLLTFSSRTSTSNFNFPSFKEDKKLWQTWRESIANDVARGSSFCVVTGWRIFWEAGIIQCYRTSHKTRRTFLKITMKLYHEYQFLVSVTYSKCCKLCDLFMLHLYIYLFIPLLCFALLSSRTVLCGVMWRSVV